MTERVRVGVIGCGKIAEKHLNAYRKLEHAEVTVSDIVERGQMIAHNYGVGWHGDPRGLIAGGDVDVVDICTPTPSHCELILAALESGKHVFCEKPLARNLAEADAINRKAAETGKLLMVGYIYRFHPAIQFAREVLTEGILGDPYYASFRLGGRGSHKAWKHRLETGGGAGNEMLVHMLDLALWYFGDLVRVDNLYSDTILRSREIEGKEVEADAEDIVVLRLETDRGVQVLCQSDLITPGYMNHVEIQGTNGSLFTSILDYLPTMLFCKSERGVYNRGTNFFEFPKVDLFERELAHFLDSVQSGARDGLNSGEDSLRLMNVIEGILPGHMAASVRAEAEGVDRLPTVAALTEGRTFD